MKNLIDYLKQHKKLTITVVMLIVVVGTTLSVIVTHQQRVATSNQQTTEQALTQAKIVALKLIENEKDVVKDNAEALKIQSELQQAIQDNDIVKINTLKQQYVEKVVALKTVAQATKEKEEQVKKESEEKAEQEEKKEETTEEKQEEQSNSNNSTVAVNNHSSSTTNNNTTQSVKKEQPKSTTPAPAPKQEQPKKEEKKEEYYPNKYCTYNGNRQRVRNICMYGNPHGTKNVSLSVIKLWTGYVNNKMIEKIVWKDEPERYYLLEETGNMKELLEALKRPSTPNDARCFVNGRCMGFNV